jgi:hypothetical protein
LRLGLVLMRSFLFPSETRRSRSYFTSLQLLGIDRTSLKQLGLASDLVDRLYTSLWSAFPLFLLSASPVFLSHPDPD